VTKETSLNDADSIVITLFSPDRLFALPGIKGKLYRARLQFKLLGHSLWERQSRNGDVFVSGGFAAGCCVRAR